MKSRIILSCILSFILLVFLYFSLEFISYEKAQKVNTKRLSYCRENNDSDCYKQMFELILPKLLIYDAIAYNQKLTFAKIDNSMIWYPFYIFDNTSYFISLYDVSIHSPIDNKLYEDNVGSVFKHKIFKLGYNSDSEKEEQINKLTKLLGKIRNENSKIILEIDIKGLDKELFSKLIEYTDVIEGYIILLHMNSTNNIIDASQILDKINQDYILIGRNTELATANSWVLLNKNKYNIRYTIDSKYYEGYLCNSMLILSFAKKDLFDNYHISIIQDTDKIYKGENVLFYRSIYETPKSNIHYTVTITEMIKQQIRKWKKQQ